MEIISNNIQNSEINQNIQNNQNNTKIFYVCSYGGCGSKMLCKYLSNFGEVKHIHSRNPPQELEYIGDKSINILAYKRLFRNKNLRIKYNNEHKYKEWFNGEKIPDNDLNNYYVIYIYKDPVKSIFSRFKINQHLIHVQVNQDNILGLYNNVLEQKKDLYGIEEFYNNYMTPNKRNYKIYGIRYEDIFDNLEELNKTFGLSNEFNHTLVKKETKREYPENELMILEEIYKPLKDKMSKNKFIEIIE